MIDFSQDSEQDYSSEVNTSFPDYSVRLNTSHANKLRQDLGLLSKGQELTDGLILDRQKMEEVFSPQTPDQEQEAYFHAVVQELRNANILGPIDTFTMYLTRDQLNPAQSAGLRTAIERFINEYPQVEKQIAVLEVLLDRTKKVKITANERLVGQEALDKKKDSLLVIADFKKNKEKIEKLMSLAGKVYEDFPR